MLCTQFRKRAHPALRDRGSVRVGRGVQFFCRGRMQITRVLFRGSIFLILIHFALLPPAANSEDAIPRIALKGITGNPGAELMVPLYFTSGSVPLRSFLVDIEYVSNHLKFEKISEGILPEGVTADIEGKVTDGPPNPSGVIRSQVRVSISLTGPRPAKGVPDGLLAFLLFSVSRDAKPFIIKLVPTLVSAEDMSTPPRTIAKADMVPGTVTIESFEIRPEVICFFFTH